MKISEILTHEPSKILQFATPYITFMPLCIYVCVHTAYTLTNLVKMNWSRLFLIHVQRSETNIFRPGQSRSHQSRDDSHNAMTVAFFLHSLFSHWCVVRSVVVNLWQYDLCGFEFCIMHDIYSQNPYKFCPCLCFFFLHPVYDKFIDEAEILPGNFLPKVLKKFDRMLNRRSMDVFSNN